MQQRMEAGRPSCDHPQVLRMPKTTGSASVAIQGGARRGEHAHAQAPQVWRAPRARNVLPVAHGNPQGHSPLRQAFGPDCRDNLAPDHMRQSGVAKNTSYSPARTASKWPPLLVDRANSGSARGPRCGHLIVSPGAPIGGAKLRAATSAALWQRPTDCKANPPRRRPLRAVRGIDDKPGTQVRRCPNCPRCRSTHMVTKSLITHKATVRLL